MASSLDGLRNGGRAMLAIIALSAAAASAWPAETPSLDELKRTFARPDAVPMPASNPGTPEEIALGALPGHHHHGEVGQAPVRVHHAHELRASHLRHEQVEQDDIGAVLNGKANAEVTITGFSNDLEVGRAFEQGAQATAEEGVVVDEQDADGGGCHGVSILRVRESCNRTSVPCSGVDWMVS